MRKKLQARSSRLDSIRVRDWEQHHREPDVAAKSYLEVIAREPEAVRRALGDNMNSAALDAIAAEGYRSGKLGRFLVQRWRGRACWKGDAREW